MSLVDIKQRAVNLTSISTISFDVFDTVLFRKQGTWLDFLVDLGAKLIEEKLISTNLSPSQFAKIRLKAEEIAHKEAAAGKVYALPLTDIYARFPTQYLGDGVGSVELATREYEFEKASAYSLPGMVSVIEELIALGKQVCFISNTYYTKPELTEILRHIGMPSASLLHVFCSCEYGRPKQRGLFLDAMAELRISPRNLIHSGDNVGIDVKAAEALKIRVTPYLGDTRKWDGERSIDQARNVSENLRRCGRYHSQNTAYQDFGYTVLGPVVAGFISWLLDIACDQKKTCLLFAEREGIFFKSVADLVLRKTEKIQFRALTTSQIAVSRAAVLPLLDGEGPLDLQLDSANRRLDIGIDPFETENRNATIKSTFSYFDRHLENSDNCLFVDIGYKGTINKYLNHYLKNEGKLALPGAYLCHSGSFNEKNFPSFGYLSEYDLPEPVLSKTMKGLSFLEQCFMPPLGSVIGFDKRGKPLRDEMRLSPKQISEQAQVQAGIIAFVDDLTDICRSSSIDLSAAVADRETARDSITALLSNPSASVRDLAQNWCHEVNFGSKSVIPVSAAASLNLTGYSKEILAEGKGWVGALWQTPLYCKSDDLAISSAHLCGTTARGPVGPGKIKSTHPKDQPVVAHHVMLPKGEELSTLRLSRLNFSTNHKVFKIKLTVARHPTLIKIDTTYETLVDETMTTTVSINWSEKNANITADFDQLIDQIQTRSSQLFLKFNTDREIRNAFVKIEPMPTMA